MHFIMVLLKIIIMVSKNYSFYTKIFSDCKKIRENVRGIGTTRQSRGIFDDERVAQWYIRDGSELNSKIILGVTDRPVPCWLDSCPWIHFWKTFPFGVWKDTISEVNDNRRQIFDDLEQSASEAQETHELTHAKVVFKFVEWCSR